MKITVRLKDNTIGTVDKHIFNEQFLEDFIGQKIKVNLHDENGNPIEKCGILAEVLG